MTDRNILKTDSISSLIYKEIRGEHRGYRKDLLSEEAPDTIKNFIFCSQCEGISRRPRLTEGKTFCTPCLKDTRATVDSRVDEIVSQLKSRCPLSTRGCDWLGQLRHIQQHMDVCGKLRIECEIGCGEVFERCETDEHLKKCPLRREQCEYCGEEVQAIKANQHISLCPIHPDGEVLCPYKEVGCDVLGIKRRNLDVHLADDSIGHQKLMLIEIHQLRSENDKLRDATEEKVCQNSKKLQCLKADHLIMHKNLKRRDKKGWILLALVVLGIALLVAYLHTERDRMNVNEQSIQSNKQSMQTHEQSNIQSIQTHEQSIQSNIQSLQTHEESIQSNIQSIQSHRQSIQSNKQYIRSHEQSIQSHGQSMQSHEQSIQSHGQSMQSHEQSIQSHGQSIQSHEQSIQSHGQSMQSNDQSIRFLMSNVAPKATHLNDYIQDRGKTLQGVEWNHGNVGDETYYGPIFYLGTCKLRLHVFVSAYYVNTGRRDANYYVTRLRGDEDDVSDTCHITYVHLYSVNTADDSKYNEMSKSVSKKLSVGDEYRINQSFYIYAGVTLPNRIIRIYFDAK